MTFAQPFWLNSGTLVRVLAAIGHDQTAAMQHAPGAAILNFDSDRFTRAHVHSHTRPNFQKVPYRREDSRHHQFLVITKGFHTP